MIRFDSLALAAALLLGAADLDAQSRYGIFTSRGTSTPGIRCGYDCNDPLNVVNEQVDGTFGEQIDISLLGDAGSPAALLLATAPPLDCTVAFQVPGFDNQLHLDPSFILPVAPGVLAMSTQSRGSCAINTGWERVLDNLTFDFTLVGLTITVQGIVTVNGVLTFTRPIALAIV